MNDQREASPNVLEVNVRISRPLNLDLLRNVYIAFSQIVNFERKEAIRLILRWSSIDCRFRLVNLYEKLSYIRLSFSVNVFPNMFVALVCLDNSRYKISCYLQFLLFVVSVFGILTVIRHLCDAIGIFHKCSESVMCEGP